MVLFFISLVGTAHLPLPISGAVGDEILVETKLWSMGIGAGLIFHSPQLSKNSSLMYILSILDCVLSDSLSQE